MAHHLQPVPAVTAGRHDSDRAHRRATARSGLGRDPRGAPARSRSTRRRPALHGRGRGPGPGRSALQHRPAGQLRRCGVSVGRGGHLRRDLLRREPAHPRDRHPYGTGRATRGCAPFDYGTRRAPGRLWHWGGPAGGRSGDALYAHHAVRRPSGRRLDIYGDFDSTGVGGSRRQLCTLAPGDGSRPGHCATARIGKLMIILRNLEKFYEGGYGRSYVLRRVNVEIKDGEFVTIMGPSGAGKSTLLSILGMLDGAWTGEFEFVGHMVHRMKPKERVELNKKYIGFVFQSYHLIDNLTVYENLDIPLSYRNVKSSERASMVCDTLDRFHIVGKRDLYPSQLSGGQQQLVAVARAVIAHPQLILADEPTGNLHSSQGKEIMELFKKLNAEGTTIVQVTHSAENAAYGDRVIQLADGWVVSGGSGTGQGTPA